MKRENAKKAVAKAKIAIEDAAVKQQDAIVFNGKMRRLLVEGILQDIKGYFESVTDGLVEVTYGDHILKGHEFGFKVYAVKGANCTKQMFSEASSAVVNAVNYIFPSGNEQYGITVSTEDGKLEIEIVSNW